jgi:SAM-dependent methyltransferase
MTGSRTNSDSAFLREQYRSDENLNVRIQTHAKYSQPHIDFPEWVLAQIAWNGDEQVIDVGCGNGLYVEPVLRRTASYLGADLSLGMLRELPRTASRVQASAQQLPLKVGSADVVLANHMLYHVPDIDAAIGELARVVRPAGCLLAATNSDETMRELAQLVRDAERDVGVPSTVAIREPLRFTLENGEGYLRAHFPRVEKREVPSALVFTTPDPVIDYLASGRQHYFEAQTTLGWEAFAAALRRRLEAHIADAGEFRVQKLTGVFIAWRTP